MSDYPFMVVEKCPWCGAECVATIELVIAEPRVIDGLLRVPHEEQMIVMSACRHAYADNE